jgi:hypothetical protein
LESNIVLVPYNDNESMVLKLLSIINQDLNRFKSRRAKSFLRSGRESEGFSNLIKMPELLKDESSGWSDFLLIEEAFIEK